MYTRYVDDSNSAQEELPLGSRWEEGKVVIREELMEEDRQVPGDLRTARVICDAANSIDDMIKMVFDCPSMHEDGLMPILDLNVNISEQGDIHYQFYRKSMAQHLTLLERSAMSMRMKRQAMSQEVLRILRNTKRTVPWSQKAEMLSQFALRMKDSGYSEHIRQEIIEGGVKGYENQLERDLAGVCPLYRPREWDREERDKKKKIKKVAWYKPADTVLFLPPTPRSELSKSMEEILASSPWKVKVIERAGKTVNNQLSSLDPFSMQECGRDNCFVHTTGGKGDCRRPGILYRHVCQAPSCTQDGMVVWRWGETSHTAYTRGKKHLEALKTAIESRSKADLDNGLVAHYLEFHEGEEPRFKMDVVEKFERPMQRQIAEGVAIHRSMDTIVMNSKNEWIQPATSRIRVTREVTERRNRGRGRLPG